jgi:hypothetical protein
VLFIKKKHRFHSDNHSSSSALSVLFRHLVRCEYRAFDVVRSVIATAVCTFQGVCSANGTFACQVFFGAFKAPWPCVTVSCCVPPFLTTMALHKYLIVHVPVPCYFRIEHIFYVFQLCHRYCVITY